MLEDSKNKKGYGQTTISFFNYMVRVLNSLIFLKPDVKSPCFAQREQDSTACRSEAEIPRLLGDAGRPTDSKTEPLSFLTSLNYIKMLKSLNLIIL